MMTTPQGRIWRISRVDGESGEFVVTEMGFCDSRSKFRKQLLQSSIVNNNSEGLAEIRYQVTEESSCQIDIKFDFNSVERRTRLFNIMKGTFYFLDDRKNMVPL